MLGGMMQNCLSWTESGIWILGDLENASSAEAVLADSWEDVGCCDPHRTALCLAPVRDLVFFPRALPRCSRSLSSTPADQESHPCPACTHTENGAGSLLSCEAQKLHTKRAALSGLIWE